MSNFVNHKMDVGLISLGFVVALFSAGIGIGEGALLVPILISVFKFDFKKAASTSLATIIPISFIGSISHFVLFFPIFRILDIILLGAVAGAIISSHLPAPILKQTFGIFLFFIACRYVSEELFIYYNSIRCGTNYQEGPYSIRKEYK